MAALPCVQRVARARDNITMKLRRERKTYAGIIGWQCTCRTFETTCRAFETKKHDAISGVKFLIVILHYMYMVKNICMWRPCMSTPAGQGTYEPRPGRRRDQGGAVGTASKDSSIVQYNVKTLVITKSGIYLL